MRPTRAGLIRDCCVLLLLAGYAIPYFWQVLTSLKPEAELLSLPPLLPSRITWEHYRAVIEQSLIPRALGNSLGVALVTTVVALALGVLAAYALARLPVPGKSFIMLGIIAGSAFPQIATVSPLYLLMRALGLRDTWTGLVLANVSFALPLVIWLLAGFIREIPEELEQAAALDGASRVAVFRFFIALPHHDATITSGSFRTTSSARTIRCFARDCRRSSGKIGRPPAISTSSSTQQIPEIRGSSHSSKNTRGRRGSAPASVRISSRPRSNCSTSASARSAQPTRPPSMRIICRICATLR